MARPKKKVKYIYCNINSQTTLLILIANLLGLSKYSLFLLYETFGNDMFLFFDIFYKAGVLKRMTEFRMKRCVQWAASITPVCLGQPIERLSSTEMRAYRVVAPFLFESKYRIPEDELIKEIE